MLILLIRRTCDEFCEQNFTFYIKYKLLVNYNLQAAVLHNASFCFCYKSTVNMTEQFSFRAFS